MSQSPKESKLIRTARERNEAKPQWVITKVESAVLECLRENPDKQLDDIKIACVGLAFKPNIDDLRESPALNIAKILTNKFIGQVVVVEPNIKCLPGGLEKTELLKFQEAVDIADVVVVLVKHREFLRVAEMLKPNQTLVDTVGICC